ncbi:E3 ubiquitin-protein ligase SINA-like 2 [Sitophilus oryzae]|uniref:E3 ubiquitin-protein ligase SINA-like 2 n=1 Tax=Sitophilus oryzae TaxID=7048 RepID=A0A6J2X4H6_SITOR|nr:E3 ubiquitin-protein ligase SINA-like 2 [Sitophilus oryzae]XP_030764838.1 E3 ubiquitin-protein ligase SINA-like 2 [Sitophilus oryzae]
MLIYRRKWSTFSVSFSLLLCFSIFISNIWKNAFKKEPLNLDPLEYGWQFEEGKFVCKWFEGDQLPSSVEMITQEDTNAEGTDEADEDELSQEDEDSDESDNDSDEEDDD